MKTDPLVSVLVHTRNSGMTIRKHLESIRKQNYQEIEIVMVDNNSTDNTVQIAKEFIDTIYNHGPERSAQRNFAAKKAHGKYYLVPDSDMILGKHVIRNCVDLIENNPDVKAITIPEKSLCKGYYSGKMV